VTAALLPGWRFSCAPVATLLRSNRPGFGPCASRFNTSQDALQRDLLTGEALYRRKLLLGPCDEDLCRSQVDIAPAQERAVHDCRRIADQQLVLHWNICEIESLWTDQFEISKVTN
jgi:hypothetical protein